MMRVLGLVPARAGRPRTIRSLAGRPLLDYTAEVALKARRVSRVILSTEDPEIASVGARCGLEVPFLRPKEFARRNVPAINVVRHALEWIEGRGEHIDAVCLLPPTSPFRRPEEIDGSIELLERCDADAVVTVRAVPPEHDPRRVYFRSAQGYLRPATGGKKPIPRRRNLPAAFWFDGSVSVTRRDVIVEQNSLSGRALLGYVLEGQPRMELKGLDDWGLAEELLRSHPIRTAP